MICPVGVRARPLAFACLLVTLMGCGGDPARVTIDLVHSESLDPGMILRRLTLTVRDATTGAQVASNTLSESGIQPAGELIDLSDLEPGRRYVLSLSAETHGVCRDERLSGRS